MQLIKGCRLVDVFELARKTDFRDVEHVAAAMAEMTKFSDAEIDRIMFYKLVQTDRTFVRTAISLATLERERRTAKAAQDLAFKTTKLAGWMGIIGTLFGVVLSAILALLLQFF